MEETQAFENRVLERLNAGKTVRSFLIATVELLTEAVNILVLQVFRKDDYAVKYAVEPLLDGDGPLGDLSVRLKLIYGLGVISRAEYEDAELLMALREELNHDGNEYSFTDDEILGPFGELHCVTALPPTPLFDDSDEETAGNAEAALPAGCTFNNDAVSDRADFPNQLEKSLSEINALTRIPPGHKPAGKAACNTPDDSDTAPLCSAEFPAARAANAGIFSDTP